jgi:hypothetical protein
MAEHERQNITRKDAKDTHADRPRATGSNPRSDDAQAASEPMDLQRLPDGKAPPGRQRTGDPPAQKH